MNVQSDMLARHLVNEQTIKILNLSKKYENSFERKLNICKLT